METIVSHRAKSHGPPFLSHITIRSLNTIPFHIKKVTCPEDVPHFFKMRRKYQYQRFPNVVRQHPETRKMQGNTVRQAPERVAMFLYYTKQKKNTKIINTTFSTSTPHHVKCSSFFFYETTYSTMLLASSLNTSNMPRPRVDQILELFNCEETLLGIHPHIISVIPTHSFPKFSSASELLGMRLGITMKS